MSKLRFLFALWAAKLSRPLLKITRHNGTDFPGKLALKLCPDFLKHVGKPAKLVAVTGTNGKTTVSNLICDILEKNGWKVLNNRAGSNINSGIATALLCGCDIFGRPKYDAAVLEVDERWSRMIYPHVKPTMIAVTNLFRDSIMRNAHPEFIAGILSAAVPKETKLLLNADDVISSSIAPDNARACFGIGRMEGDTEECVNRLCDARICPKCAAPLRFEYRHYHHIGRAVCDSCGYHSPDYDYGASFDRESGTLTVDEHGEKHAYPLITGNMINIYNELTAISAARELGLSPDAIANALRGTKVAESRFDRRTVNGVTLVLQMAKAMNAPAVSRAFDFVAHEPGEKELLLMMNCLSDEEHWSENVCWLYDADFELLTGEDIPHIVCAGPRALDYKLRLLLAGVPAERIECVIDKFEATEHLWLHKGSSVYIFYGADAVDLSAAVRDKAATLCERKVFGE